VTKDEATMKWCPFARLLAHTYSQDGQGRSFEGGYSYNRSPDPDEARAPYLPDGASCIASACMSWRWHEAKRTEAFSAAVVAHMRAQPKPDHRAAVQAVYAQIGDKLEHTEGFCGLAGSPQASSGGKP